MVSVKVEDSKNHIMKKQNYHPGIVGFTALFALLALAYLIGGPAIAQKQSAMQGSAYVTMGDLLGVK